MFDEISTQSAEHQAPYFTQQSPYAKEISQLTQFVGEVMMIEDVLADESEELAARFVGRLIMESATAYDHLDDRLAELGFYAHLAYHESTERHIIVILRGRIDPAPRPWWPNALLFGLTVLTTMTAGAIIGGANEINGIMDILQGWPYSLSILLILGAHELGHYFAARYHKVAVTLPYFIPMLPPPITLTGTLGAVIQLRQLMRNRKQLFDVGVAGPLAGLVFAIPILIIGVATADVSALPTAADCAENEMNCAYILEGNSIFYATVKFVVHGKWLPSDAEDMTINQVSLAGWTGLFVTALNLLPIGQLDGGHILYTLIGKRTKQLYWPLVALIALLSLNSFSWFWLFLLLVFFGRTHAVPLDDVTPLGPKRRLLGIVTLLLLIFLFIPVPIQIIELN